jgi:hypothetical protein
LEELDGERRIGMPSEIMTKQEPQVKSWYLTQETPLPQYYQFPEFLLKAPVSQTAKILYMVLYDRARLSQKNNWTDDIGRIYLIFPIIELAAKTGRSVSAVKAGLNELLAADLLEKARCGFGSPNRLYVKIPSENGPSVGLNSCYHTDGKPSTKQVKKTNKQNQNAWSSYRPASRYTGKRASAFEDYSYDGEDSF